MARQRHGDSRWLAKDAIDAGQLFFAAPFFWSCPIYWAAKVWRQKAADPKNGETCCAPDPGEIRCRTPEGLSEASADCYMLCAFGLIESVAINFTI